MKKQTFYFETPKGSKPTVWDSDYPMMKIADLDPDLRWGDNELMEMTARDAKHLKEVWPDAIRLERVDRSTDSDKFGRNLEVQEDKETVCIFCKQATIVSCWGDQNDTFGYYLKCTTCFASGPVRDRRALSYYGYGVGAMRQAVKEE